MPKQLPQPPKPVIMPSANPSGTSQLQYMHQIQRTQVSNGVNVSTADRAPKNSPVIVLDDSKEVQHDATVISMGKALAAAAEKTFAQEGKKPQQSSAIAPQEKKTQQLSLMACFNKSRFNGISRDEKSRIRDEIAAVINETAVAHKKLINKVEGHTKSPESVAIGRSPEPVFTNTVGEVSKEHVVEACLMPS